MIIMITPCLNYINSLVDEAYMQADHSGKSGHAAGGRSVR